MTRDDVAGAKRLRWSWKPVRAWAFAAFAALMLGVAAAPPASATEPEAASKPFTICDDQTYALCATAECTMFNNVAYCKCDVAAMIFGASAGTRAYAVEAEATARKPVTICEDQTYALCFTSICTMFNNVAYCTCDVSHGDSISLTQSFQGGDVCSFNARGKRNGYMVSTYSTPPSVLKPNGDQAIYDCAKETATGSWAQCDGGVCWESSRGQKFPGLGKLDRDEIVCACPTVTADPDTATIGYQIVGPYPCQNDFFKYCDSATANTDNGSYIYSGAFTGSSQFVSKKLYGVSLPFNRCRRPD